MPLDCSKEYFLIRESLPFESGDVSDHHLSSVYNALRILLLFLEILLLFTGCLYNDLELLLLFLAILLYGVGSREDLLDLLLYTDEVLICALKVVSSDLVVGGYELRLCGVHIV